MVHLLAMAAKTRLQLPSAKADGGQAKKIVLGIVILVLLASAFVVPAWVRSRVQTQQPAWKTYKDENAGFSVAFPVSLKKQTTDIVYGDKSAHVPYTMLTSTFDKKTYIVSYFSLPQGTDTSQTDLYLLSSAKWIIGLFYEGQIEDSKATKVQNYPAIDYTFRNPANTTHSHFLTLLANNTVYSVGIAAEKGQDFSNFKTFVGSFIIAKK